MTRRHWLVLAAGVVAVSWAAPLIRLTEAPAIVVAALRLTAAAPPVAGAALWRRRAELRSMSRASALALVVAGLALAAHFGFWIASLDRTSVITSVVLVTTHPLFVALGGWWLLDERPARSIFPAIAVAFVGALILVRPDLRDSGTLLGALFALLGALFAAGYFVAGRWLRAELSNLSYVAGVNTIAAVALLVALFASGHTVGGQPRDAYLYIVLLALVPQLIGHGAFNWALGSLPAAIVAVPILGEAVGATLISATLLDEVPTLRQWLGSAIVLSGVYVALRSARAGQHAPVAPQR